MRARIHLLITLGVVLPIWTYSSYLFFKSLDSKVPFQSLLSLKDEQVNYLLLMTVCLILVYELVEQESKKKMVCQILLFKFDEPLYKRIIISFIRGILTFLLLISGFAIPFLDLLGSFPFSFANNIPQIVPKVTLLLLTSIYVYHLLERTHVDIELIQKLMAQEGHITVLNRKEDHEFMSNMLDSLLSESSILVTHFEEPQNPLQSKDEYVYYYEDDFMKKWYNTIKTKQLKVTQIILVNSNEDIIGLEKRLEIVKDLPNFTLAYILAPPCTIFVDFMVVPEKFVLIAFSDNKAMRNMNVFAFLIRNGPAVTRFEHVFTDILIPDARYIKTFEGVNEDALNELRDKVLKISRSSSTVLHDIFNFK